MKRRDPSTEPCGISKRTFRQSLKLKPIFAFCFQLVKKAKMKFSAFIPNPNVFNLVINNSCEIQSKFFDRSVNTAANTSLLFCIFRTFSIISKRQCCVANPFLKPHWYLQSLFIKKLFIWLCIILSYFFEILDEVLTDLRLFFLERVCFLKN